jgi:homoserine trans-succinylase
VSLQRNFVALKLQFCIQRGVDKSLARPTSRFILFDGENISIDASLAIYINSTTIPPIMIINRICETQNLLSL